MRGFFRIRWVLVTILLGATACRPPGTPSPAEGPTEDCLLFPGSVRSAGTIRIGAAGDVRLARAPEPRTDAERILFRHLYEPLVRVDCRGRAYPGLARSWSSSEGGRVWEFTLREGAAFWSGESVTARDVVRSWTAREASLATLLPWEGPRTSATAAGDRVVRVALTSPEPSPNAFAHPALALTLPGPAGGWAEGTGVHRIAGVLDGPRGIAITVHPIRGPDRPTLRFRAAPAARLRDLIDEGVDVLWTRDASALEYAATLPDLVTVPLPWDRVYALAVPRPEGERHEERGDFLERLARDAVRTSARAVESDLWLEEPGACELTAPAATASVGRSGSAPEAPRIVYDERDPDARALAERLVALLGSRGTRSQPIDAFFLAIPRLLEGTPVAVGLNPGAFAAALRAGRDAAYVLAVPRSPLSTCAEWNRLRAAAPWLPSAEPARALLPLVETRPSVVARRGLAGAAIDLDGTIHLESAGWSRREMVP